MSRIMWMVCLCLLAAGCASTSGPERNLTVTGMTGLDSLSGLPVGQTLIADDQTYTLNQRYVAASGRRCAKLQSVDGELRVACADPAGGWYLRKPLKTSARSTTRRAVTDTRDPQLLAIPSNQSPTIADTTPPTDSKVSILIEPSAVDAGGVEVDIDTLDTDSPAQALRQEKVLPDETLWRFAKRVTGNALNWERIAAFNNIDNAVALQAGRMLSIPSDLPIADSDR